MSVKIMSWVWDHSPYENTTLLILLAMADFADDDGVCWPSQARLMGKARCSERTVRDAVKRMVADGVVEIVSESSGRTSHRYRIRTRQILPPGNMEQPNPAIYDTSPGNMPPENHQEPPTRTITTPDGFDEFWSAYPRREGKVASERAYRAAVKRESASALIAAAHAYASATRNTEKRFIKQASSWLNGGFYDAHAEESSAPKRVWYCPECDEYLGDKPDHVCGAS